MTSKYYFTYYSKLFLTSFLQNMKANPNLQVYFTCITCYEKSRKYHNILAPLELNSARLNPPNARLSLSIEFMSRRFMYRLLWSQWRINFVYRCRRSRIGFIVHRGHAAVSSRLKVHPSLRHICRWPTTGSRVVFASPEEICSCD